MKFIKSIGASISNTGRAISTSINNTKASVNKSVKAFVTSLKPTYSVEVDIYHFIPGLPVNKQTSRQDFGKGEIDSAKALFEKAVAKNKELKLVPSEVKLIKGKSKVIAKQPLGPVDQMAHMHKKHKKMKFHA
jgi:hypothetical protein